MNTSEKFCRSLDRIGTRYGKDGLAVTVEAVREVFVQDMGKVPEDLVRSIYLRFLDGFNRSGRPESEFVEAAYGLGAYVDLFWKEYEEEDHSLSEEDWTFLREEVSGYAGELDLDILTHVMQQIVSRGKI